MTDQCLVTLTNDRADMQVEGRTPEVFIDVDDLMSTPKKLGPHKKLVDQIIIHR